MAAGRFSPLCSAAFTYNGRGGPLTRGAVGWIASTVGLEPMMGVVQQIEHRQWVLYWRRWRRSLEILHSRRRMFPEQCGYEWLYSDLTGNVASEIRGNGRCGCD